MKMSEDELIMKFFMEEKEYVCPMCETRLISTFEEDGPVCPSCSYRMVDIDKLERIYRCPACGYLVWVVPEAGELPQCDTCGYDLSTAKFTTRARLTRGGSSLL